MWQYFVRPFGRATTFDGRTYEDYDEFRIFFRDDGRDRGLFRLSRSEGGWSIPHLDVIGYMLDARAGGRPIPFKYKLVEPISVLSARGRIKTVFETSLVYDILGVGVRVGPLQRHPSKRLVFVYDLEGGCTGYCYLHDLRRVHAALSEIWAAPREAGSIVHLYEMLAPSVLAPREKDDEEP